MGQSSRCSHCGSSSSRTGQDIPAFLPAPQQLKVCGEVIGKKGLTEKAHQFCMIKPPLILSLPCFGISLFFACQGIPFVFSALFPFFKRMVRLEYKILVLFLNVLACFQKGKEEKMGVWKRIRNLGKFRKSERELHLRETKDTVSWMSKSRELVSAFLQPPNPSPPKRMLPSPPTLPFLSPTEHVNGR